MKKLFLIVLLTGTLFGLSIQSAFANYVYNVYDPVGKKTYSGFLFVTDIFGINKSPFNGYQYSFISEDGPVCTIININNTNVKNGLIGGKCINASVTPLILLGFKNVNDYVFEWRETIPGSLNKERDAIRKDSAKMGYYEYRGNDWVAELIKSVEELTPEDYVIWGNKFRETGDFQSTIAFCTKAISLSPDYVDAYILRANAYAHSNQSQKAIQDYTKAISLKPDIAEFYVGRAGCYGLLKEYQKAIKDLTKAISLKPDYKSAYQLRAELYQALGQRQQAELDYRKAKQLGY